MSRDTLAAERAYLALLTRLTHRTTPDGRTWLSIVEAAAQAEGAAVDDVGTKCRLASPVRARHAAWRALAEWYSTREIARVWGAGTSASTVREAVLNEADREAYLAKKREAAANRRTKRTAKKLTRTRKELRA